MKNLHTFSLIGFAIMVFIGAPGLGQSKDNPVDKFRQLEEILPTPNAERIASGAPGPGYWQQRADYKMRLELDDENQRLTGSEMITYHNLSPHQLSYVWVQLDQNRFEKNSDDQLTATAPEFEKEGEDGVDFGQMMRVLNRRDFDGGFKITSVKDENGNQMQRAIVKTMMRIELSKPLAPGHNTVFSIDWHYNIVNHDKIGGRAGFEYFEKDDNYLYEIAQFYPRMVAYTDVNGWHHKQFLGDGEFTVDFGDYEVEITAPADHVVASSGVLQNPEEVLTTIQRKRLAQARTAAKPVIIVSQKEAEMAEKSKAKSRKTWKFKAENVRDFAFASSRKFIWDAQGFPAGDQVVMAMSYYPKEGNPLWEKYSTHSIIHTLEQYAKYTFTYPYPVAISVNGPVGGMEYPMICFNGPRPEDDGTYSKRSKYGLISVIIHEVGHNFFPMIVNSDERQWTWMDEGLNTFVQFLAEQSWEENYPSRRGEPSEIVEYMESEEQMPIMTNSESVLKLGPNAYGKPATALNILRETILGRELFDYAFKEYAQRWMFKRPMPADFFRTMEDASGVDLDWFWRGWFYSTDHTDIAINGLKHYKIDTYNPDVEKSIERVKEADEPLSLTTIRNEGIPRRTDAFPELVDFYNKNDEFTVTDPDRQDYAEFLEKLDDQERALLENDLNFYVADFENVGGLIMPILLELDFVDGEKRELRIPAEIWRLNHTNVSKLIVTEKEIRSITVDPRLETADVDLVNNHFPRKPVESRFRMFKEKKEKNLMQKHNQKREPGGGFGGRQ